MSKHYIKGQFTCTPALNKAQVAYLKAFAQSTRLQRNLQVMSAHPDPLREKVELPLGIEGEYCIDEACGVGIASWDPPNTQPDIYCAWIPSNNGKNLKSQNKGSRYYTEHHKWIEYINEHFLKPWGVVLGGAVKMEDIWGDIITVLVANGNIEHMNGEEHKRLTKAHKERQQITEQIETHSSVAKPKSKI